MKERPILFSGPMVRAILEGRKTQTRRVMNPQPAHLQHHTWRGKVVRDEEHRMWCWKNLVLENIWDFPQGDDRKELAKHCPHGVSGDRLWVRETYRETGGSGGPSHGYKFWGEYRADGKNFILDCPEMRYGGDIGRHGSTNWRPAIFMPRLVSRITLEIADVRVERLQEISEKDAEAEGVSAWSDSANYPKWKFHCLWDSINAERGFGWASNPWVWALTFKRVEEVLHTDARTDRR